MENDTANNKFVNAFINEYDAYLYSHPDACKNAGLILYTPKSTKSKCDADKHPFSDEDKLILISILLSRNVPNLMKQVNGADIVNSTIPETSKKYIIESWNALVGDADASHSRIVYRMLQNIPSNILIPLLIEIGVDRDVYKDRDLSETDFVSKYDGTIWLTSASNDTNRLDAICKLVSLNALGFIKNTTYNSGYLISDYDDESVIEFAMVFTMLKSKYPSEYEQFLQIEDNSKILESPGISLLRQLANIAQRPEIIYEPIFESVHKNTYLESQGAIKTITDYGSKIPVFITAYEHYCYQNGYIPKEDIIRVKESTPKRSDEEDFVEKFNTCRVDSSDTPHLLLPLSGKNVFELYNFLIDGSVNGHQVSLSQFCYALTGRMTPDEVVKIKWLSSVDEFAILLTLLYPNKSKPYKDILAVFECDDSRFNSVHLSSRCTRLFGAESDGYFKNRIKEALKNQ